MTPAPEPGPAAGRAPLFPQQRRALYWFLRDRFLLLHALADEHRVAPLPPEACRERFERAVRQGRHVLVVRLVVTVLLALGVIASIVSALLATNAPALFADEAAAFSSLLTRVAAYATSATAVLLAIRLLLERVLARYDTLASFLAARL